MSLRELRRDAVTQVRCPECPEFRRGYRGRHGLICHMFFDHRINGNGIQKLLPHVMGTEPLSPTWFDEYVETEEG